MFCCANNSSITKEPCIVIGTEELCFHHEHTTNMNKRFPFIVQS